MTRVRKLKLTQLSLLIIGLLIVFFTYFEKERSDQEKIISRAEQEKIDVKLKKYSDENNVFYNIQYTGIIDLEGNRYTIKSEEALSSSNNTKIVNMKKVHATFLSPQRYSWG